MAFTLAGPREYREEIRKSRFLAQAHPLSNADQAKQGVCRLLVLIIRQTLRT